MITTRNFVAILLLFICTFQVSADSTGIYPMMPGTIWSFQEGSSIVTETVLADTVTINGIETTVVFSSSGEENYSTSSVDG